jgi:hypothetical protein
MKQSNLTFGEGFLGIQSREAAEKGAIFKAFDWDKAAEIIKNKFKLYPDLLAEAGLQGDWNYTSGTIFKEGEPVIGSYKYLCSNWAIPTLILSWDDEEQEEIDCWVEANERFHSDSDWDQISLDILNDTITVVKEDNQLNN